MNNTVKNINIVVKKLTVTRENNNLLYDINFNLGYKENLAILGPSGSGKSLLAKAIKGQLLHTGSIEFFRNDAIIKPNIAYVAPTYILKNRSNLHNFYYQQRFNTCDSEDANNLLDELLKYGKLNEIDYWIDKFQLSHRIKAPLIQLSNGELKKMQLISHLLRKPEILILDKVFTGLDKKSRKELSLIIDDLSLKGVKIILITDNKNIPSCITTFAEINNGKLINYETIEKIEDKLYFTKNKYFSLNLPKIAKVHTDVPLIKMSNVSIRYGENTILNNINWQVNSGECWHIKGSNGAGKSTLLSLINGDNPQAYSQNIYLFGKKRGSGESIWDIKKKIGFVSPELHNFFDSSTSIEQAIASGFFDTIGLFRKLDNQKKNKVNQWLKFFSLEDKSQRLLSSLSSGEMRLVLIARALIKDPLILALDEAFQGLDNEQIKSFIELLDRIHSETKISILFISHYDEEIPSCVKKVLELNKGIPTITERN